jgi:fumarate hydratase class II
VLKLNDDITLLKSNMMAVRIEKDSIGTIEVPAEKYWAAQTQRSMQNFKIGGQAMPSEVVKAFAILKKAAAMTNAELGVLDSAKSDVIGKVMMRF